MAPCFNLFNAPAVRSQPSFPFLCWKRVTGVHGDSKAEHKQNSNRNKKPK